MIIPAEYGMPNKYFGPSTFIQNLPIPSASDLDTLTKNYDHRRFFCKWEDDVKYVKPQEETNISAQMYISLYNYIDNINSKLHETLSQFIGDIKLEIDRKITDAMIGCVVSKGVKFPLIFEVFNQKLKADVFYFCFKNGILRYLPIAIDLIRNNFSSMSGVHLQPEKDPETEDEWLSLDVTIQGEVDEVLTNYDNYTRQKVSSIPWPERDRIRLSYNII